MDGKGEQLMLLDITKLKREVVDVVVEETCQVAAAKQAAVDAVERDPSMTREQRREAVGAIMTADLRFLVEMHNSNDEFGKYIHGAAHQMIDACNSHEDKACKTVVFSFMQIVCLGWRLASAHLENLSLEKSAN